VPDNRARFFALFTMLPAKVHPIPVLYHANAAENADFAATQWFFGHTTPVAAFGQNREAG
jgi:hypothetical protein